MNTSRPTNVYWLLIVSVVASLAALCSAAYATLGAIRGHRANPRADADTLVELDVGQS